MLSLKTCIELTYIVEKLSNAEIDRIFHAFGHGMLLTPPFNEQEKPKTKKVNALLQLLNAQPEIKGPFSQSFKTDLLQYLIDQHYRYKSEWDTDYEDSFMNAYSALANTLKADGFVVKGKVITRLLPEEIEEVKTESELMSMLEKFQLYTAKGHLSQVRDNHSLGHWAAANSQCRTFTESLLIGVCGKILPGNTCDNAAAAIKLLSLSASPPFLSPALNEVESTSCNTPFVVGLWKRLHPDGSHPGLSDEEDSTFRYHIVIVFAHYLLKRLERRLNPKKNEWV